MKITNLVLVLILVSGISLFGNENGNADARYFSIVHEYTLNDDGTITYNYKHTLQLYTSYAFSNRYGESFIIYNPEWQKLVINNSTTTMVDGKVVESPFNAFNEVLPQVANQNGPYLNLREMVVTHIGLEKDCTIDFGYTITTQNGMYPGMFGKHILGDRCPMDGMEIVVRIPKGKILSYYFSVVNFIPQKSEEGEYDIYTWKFGKLPLIEAEAMQPHMEEFIPTLYFSTATADEVVSHILKDKSLFNLSNSTAAFAAELTKDDKTNLDKAFTLQNYVAKNIGSMDGNLAYVGYQPMAAENVYIKNSGTQLDKAILLSAMLKSIGLDALPVLVSNSSKVKNDVSLLSQFENALVKCDGVLPSGEALFLDPTEAQDNLLPKRIVDRTYFTIETNPICEQFTTERLKENSLSMQADLIPTESGELTGRANFDMMGYFVQGYKSDVLVSAIEKKMKKEHFTFLIDPEENYNLSKSNFSGKGNITIPVEKNEAAGYYELSLPLLPNGVNDLHLNINKSNRTTPVYLPVKLIEKYDFTITLPENQKLVVIPDPIILKNQVGELLSVFTAEGDRLNVKRQITFNTVEVGPDQYNDFYELVSGWQDKYHNKLYIQSK